MKHWTCGGCSSPETGEPAGILRSGQYEGPQCEACWDVHEQEQAAEERWWQAYEEAMARCPLTES